MYINVNILKGIKALNNCNKALMKTKQKSEASQTLKQIPKVYQCKLEILVKFGKNNQQKAEPTLNKGHASCNCIQKLCQTWKNHQSFNLYGHVNSQPTKANPT